MPGSFDTTLDTRQSLFAALLAARRRRGAAMPVVEDAERQRMTYGRLILASVALGRRLARFTRRGEAVGVLVPNAAGVAAVFFALQALGRVPAMLNFTMGEEALRSACATARIRTVLTSRRFVAKAKLEPVVAALGTAVDIRYLEDLRREVGLADTLPGLLVSRLPSLPLLAQPQPDETAVVLFTSGSEGMPKGVALSHANILSNISQITQVVEFLPTDRVVNPLPVFHSFGLTDGLLLPLVLGIPVVLHPNPLQYRAVAELVEAVQGTILFGTDTFLSGYARASRERELVSIRFAVAGAEPVRDATRAAYRERFGVTILEGYGTTETAPVLALNTPTHSRPGTVGRLLPGIEHRLEPVQGVPDGGRLLVRGPNVMRGYLSAERPGAVLAPPDGWHDTGDIVGVDADGYVRILGRVKRFAKVGGEMISLATVEAHAARLWPENAHAALTLPDPRKGERIVLVTDRTDATREALVAHARAHGIAEIEVPKAVLVVPEIPTLGSGKADRPAIRRLAEERLGVG